MRAARTLIAISLVLLGCREQGASSTDSTGASSNVGGQFLQQDSLPAFVPGEIIVKFRSGTFTPAAAVLSQLQLQDTERRTAGGEMILRVTLDSNVVGVAVVRARAEQALRALRDRGDVEYAQLNYILRHQGLPGISSEFSTQWNLRSNGTAADQSPGGMSATDAWRSGATGSREVNVSVLDTGILEDHPTFAVAGNLFPGYDFISDLSKANDGNGRDGDPRDPGDACGTSPNSWHGTHVAGILGAGGPNGRIDYSGVLKYAHVQMVRVLGRCGGNTDDIIDAIRWAAGIAVAGTSPNPSPARILNMSLGARLPCDSAPAFQQAIDDVVRRGVIVVVAAGNSGRSISDFHPAGCRNVVAVTAADARGILTRYSNYGPAAAVMAPGGDGSRVNVDPHEGILGPVSGGRFDRYSGTSMAAPHVAAVVALWLSKNRAWRTNEVLTELQRTSLPRSSAQCPRECGSGLLSARP